MSRVFQFRAWSKDKKNWVSARNLSDPRNIPVTPTKRGFKLKSKFELSQFTGLKDRAGVDIYEGDIVTYEWIGGESGKLRVIYWYGEFRACRYNNVPGPDATGNMWYESLTESLTAGPKVQFRVIGNIWENPEMMGT